jgi:hypothetical protein
MLGQNFVVGYVQVCTSGKLPLSDCGPVWQLCRRRASSLPTTRQAQGIGARFDCFHRQRNQRHCPDASRGAPREMKPVPKQAYG